jgi:hypothetical protein
MAFFKKNNQVVEVLNKMNTVENKIDILSSKLESVTFMDGCCDCKKRETQIYTDLQEYLDDKLLNIKNSLLDCINDNFHESKKDTVDDDSDSSSDIMEGLENLELKLKSIIEDVYDRNRNELLETLQKCCEHQSNKSDLYSNINELLLQTKNDILDKYKTNDLSLRNDLQTFLVGLQTEFTISIHGQNDTLNTKLNSYNTELSKKINELNQSFLSLQSSVNGFYYENEIIKHQLVLEDDIRKYNDEIENVKLLAMRMKNSIESILSDYEFEK